MSTPILLRILALTDATFAPFRASPRRKYLNDTSCNAAMQRQAEFPVSGVPFISTGSSAQRKEAERRMGELETQGLLRLHGRSGRREGVSLTDYGDSVARWSANLPMLCEAWGWFDLLASIADLLKTSSPEKHDPTKHHAGTYTSVPENFLTGVYNSEDPLKLRKLLILETQFAPFLARGLVRSSSDYSGCATYGITPDGYKVLAAGKPPTPSPLPAFVSADSVLHDRLYAEALSEREGWKPEKTNWLYIPHSAGLYPAFPPELAELLKTVSHS